MAERAAPLSVRPGAWRDGAGVHFGVASRHASGVSLCLFDEGRETRIPMTRLAGDVWHHRLPLCAEGQSYGFRAAGPWAPESGHYFNDHRLLLDPAAHALEGSFRWHPSVMTVPPSDPAFVLDSAPFVPRARVATPVAFGGHSRPCIPWQDTVIYELHVKGATVLHPMIDAGHCGRYEGLCAPAFIDHLKRIGVTTLELLPLHEIIDEQAAIARGQVNYWGYNPLAWRVPTARYARAEAVGELCHAVDRLHACNIEVILDVVFNHTAETDTRGPTLGLRGLDNALFYQHRRNDSLHAVDASGCGNTVSLEHPYMLRLVLDSLRHWAVTFGVDGFRLDLASALTRDAQGFDAHHPFWMAILQDPLLASLKWIVEPWDATAEGYQPGRYLPGFFCWNDRFRDQVRRQVRGDAGQQAALARTLAGSWDVFNAPGSSPWTSINFITAHDGFTLRDLVSYSRRHNLANGENNRDGCHENYSDNAGVEGDCDDADVMARRQLRRRNAFFLLAFSVGVPMMSHGDEIGRTQAGNNNAWCHDSALTWCDWAQADHGMLAFVQSVFSWRRRLAWGSWLAPGLEGWRQVNGNMAWFRHDGLPMQQSDWNDPALQACTLRIITSGHVLWLVVNNSDEAITLVLPVEPSDGVLECVIDTGMLSAMRIVFECGAKIEVSARAQCLLRQIRLIDE